MLSITLSLSLSLFLGAVDVTDQRLPSYHEEIFVVGQGPFIAPVAPGQPVKVVFGVGELDIEAQPISEVRAHIEVRCPKGREARCGKVRKKLRVEPRQTSKGLEVRLTGVSTYLLRRLEIHGKVTVPEDSALAVEAGIGDVEVRAGTEGVAVRMGIGDLRVRAPEETIGSVNVRTRIGDSGLRTSQGHRAGKRKTLIGAGLRWSDGPGEESVDVRLRIGDAQVTLE